jgi:hypothetical protein
MATEAKQHLLEAIADAVVILKERAQAERQGGGKVGYKPEDLLRLAEAYAWAITPGNPHGGQMLPPAS